jgi:hypothetical protein
MATHSNEVERQMEEALGNTGLDEDEDGNENLEAFGTMRPFQA